MKKNYKVILAILFVVSVLTGVFLSIKYFGFFHYQWTRFISSQIYSYERELVELSKKDPEQAFARFKEILNDNPLSYNSCHGLAHQMGHETYEEFGFAKAMKISNTLCGGGYVHGVIEGKFGYLQESDLLDEVKNVCDKDDLICAHGIGHGLMIATNLDINKSLEYCDLLEGLSVRNCYDGVWMHIFDLEESGARKNIQGKFDQNRIAESENLCTSSEDRYKTSCYFYLPRIFAHFEEVPFENQIDLCSNAENEYRVTCAAGSGHSNMKYHIADPNASLDVCDKYSGELEPACTEGSLIYYLYSIETSSDTKLNLKQECASLNEEAVCLKVLQYRSNL